jgi:PIN domain nuclease of toxin-antitoxin system
MRFLLDTHALLWWLFDDSRISTNAGEIVADPENEILVSSASAWEIATKHRLGRLSAANELVRDLTGWIERARFRELPIRLVHAQRAGSWPQSHRDPFDRMLAAQSAVEELPLISRDAVLATFGIRLIW